MVLLKQMQKEFAAVQKRRPKAEVDSLLWQRGKGKSLKSYSILGRAIKPFPACPLFCAFGKLFTERRRTRSKSVLVAGGRFELPLEAASSGCYLWVMSPAG